MPHWDCKEICAEYRGLDMHHDNLSRAGRLQQAALLQHAGMHRRHMHACCHQVQRPPRGQGCQRTGVQLNWSPQALCHICTIHMCIVKACAPAHIKPRQRSAGIQR